jgi:hypothetical protein
LAQKGAKGETAVPAPIAPRQHDSRPTTIAGHDRARWGARGVRERKANPARGLKGGEKERGSSFHGKVERGGSMAGGRRNARGGLYLGQTVKSPRAPGVRERGGEMCAQLWATVDHRRLISPCGAGGDEGSASVRSVRGEGEECSAGGETGGRREEQMRCGGSRRARGTRGPPDATRAASPACARHAALGA